MPVAQAQQRQQLAVDGQADFAAGVFRSVARHLVPPNGVYDAVDALLNDDGNVYERGGVEYQSAAFGTGDLRAVWDVELPVGRRTLFATSTAFGVLSADSATPISLGGAGLAGPKRGTVVGGLLFISDGTVYGGSRKASGYATGTVAITQGAKLVSGTGTAWLTNVDPGMLLRVDAGRYYVVDTVISDGQLTLRDPYEGTTVSGGSYALGVLGLADAPYKTSDVYAAVAGRLVAGDETRLRFSAGRSQTGVLRPHSFDDTDYHEFPGRVIGAEAIRNDLVVFTTAGVYLVSNMAFDLTDAAGNVQQSVQRLSDEVILWGQESIASWRDSLVVAGTDGVYLITGGEAPVPLGLSITPLIAGYARAGYSVGQAVVYRNHYFLPVLDLAGAPKDLLVCRLDRPIRTQLGTTFPWTRLAGQAQTRALAVRVQSTDRRPLLFAAGGDGTAGRVLRADTVFEPSAARAADANGGAVAFDLVTRDYPTGGSRKNLVRRLRLTYQLLGAGTDPTLAAYYAIPGTDPGGDTWGGFTWGDGVWSSGAEAWHLLSPGAPEERGDDPYTWLVNKQGILIRFRFRSSAAAAKLLVRAVELHTRTSGGL